MHSTSILLLFVLFSIKHFIVDFPLQGPYQYLNKGTYGHPGGLLHALYHGIATLLILLFFVSIPTAIALTLFDMIVHYHVDWLKVNIGEKKNWKCDNSKQYWILLGADQLLHMLTYIAIIALVV